MTTMRPNYKALLACASTVFLCCVATLSYAEKNCEEGATSMAQIYECLALRKAASVEAQYDNLSDALAARGMSDALERLENSQLAWESDTKAFCNILQDIAEPSFGLYAQDLGSNCQSLRGRQRGEALKLLYLALEQQQFEQWMPD